MKTIKLTKKQLKDTNWKESVDCWATNGHVAFRGYLLQTAMPSVSRSEVGKALGDRKGELHLYPTQMILDQGDKLFCRIFVTDTGDRYVGINEEYYQMVLKVFGDDPMHVVSNDEDNPKTSALLFCPVNTTVPEAVVMPCRLMVDPNTARVKL